MKTVTSVELPIAISTIIIDGKAIKKALFEQMAYIDLTFDFVTSDFEQAQAICDQVICSHNYISKQAELYHAAQNPLTKKSEVIEIFKRQKRYRFLTLWEGEICDVSLREKDLSELADLCNNQTAFSWHKELHPFLEKLQSDVSGSQFVYIL